MTAIPHHFSDSHERGHAHEHGHAHEELGFMKKYIFSMDHKIIGIQFLFMGLIFMIVGGLLAMLIRWNLAWPPSSAVPHPVPILGKFMGWTNGLMPPDYYMMVMTMHATIMIFFVIIVLLVGTFGNYLIPLKIGAGDMAFPFLNGLAFWSALPAGAIMLAAFFMPGNAASAGWTSYPPLSAIQFNGASALLHDVNSGWANILRPLESNWPMTPVILQFLAQTLFIGYICCHYVHVSSDRAEKGSTRSKAGTALIAVGAVILAYMVIASMVNSIVPAETGVRLPVPIPETLGGIAILLVTVGVAVGTSMNAGIGVLLAVIGGIIMTRAVQHVSFDGQSCWFFSLFWLGFSSLMGAVNYLTTVIKLRCPGMTMFRLPLSVWSLFITSLLVLLATPVLAATLMLNLLDHHRFTSFFEPFNWVLTAQIQTNSGGGYAIMHQHLFWFYSHPAVYIMILPAMGMVSDIIATFARKPIFGYRPMVYAIAGIAFLGFIVWAHHMFQSGMNPTLGTTFAVSTMFIAVPSAIKTFNWLGTLWRGNIRFTVPMLNALAFVSMFVIGGLSGIFMASTAVDVHIHDTYFIVAHIHYVLFGGSMFGIFAAIYYYYPKMFGRMMNNPLGYLHFIGSFVFFNGTFFAMHILGIRGFPRRIADYNNYTSFADLHNMNLFISMCAFGLGLSQIPFAINFIGSWIWGKKAPKNPWEATTLEWETESPPPHGNFHTVPVVHHGPYEYASPLVEEDYLPQTRYVEGADKLVVKH